MTTRAAAAREAAFLGSSLVKNKQDISSPTKTSKGSILAAPTANKLNFPRKRQAKTGGTGAIEQDTANVLSNKSLEDDKNTLLTLEGTGGALGADVKVNEKMVGNASRKISNKRKRTEVTSKNKNNSTLVAEPVTGGWDVLPHNMGNVGGGTANDQLLDIEKLDGTASRPKKRVRAVPAIKTEDYAERNGALEDIEGNSGESGSLNFTKSPVMRRKAKATQPIKPESPGHAEGDPIAEELKNHPKRELKDVIKSEIKDELVGVTNTKPKRKRASRAKVIISEDVQQKVGELLEATEKPVKTIKKGKANPYGLTPGRSPFPDFIMPTIEACTQVQDALSKVHGNVEAPKEIPAPSLEVTGCGEVPSVLDALIRTRLSASTTSQNAKYAFTGLVERYGILEKGIGAGSVNWNKVRESDVKDIEEAIRKGGLAKTKSVSIKKILDMVHAQGLARRDAFIKERQGEVISGIVGAEKMTQGQKDMEIDVVSKEILSLDYMHGWTADEAMMEFIKFPGIGVKTASCVILFCLQRPSFAVDTHVWRFCKWLKWVPGGADRDQTFSHCEVRIPDSMKYSLHQLFIRHGKTCGRCRAITGESSEGWESTICPLENLLERTGKRKTGPPMKKPAVIKKTGKGKAKKTDEDDGEDTEVSVLFDEDLELEEEKGAVSTQSTSEDDY